MTTSSAALASAAPEAAVGPEGAKAVEVKLSAAWDHAYAGEWLPVTFDLLRPAGDPCPVRLDRLTCADDDVQLDVDLLQPGVEIRPGERYRFTAGLRVGRPKLLDLGTLSLWFKQQGDDERAIGQKVSTQKMTVRAFIGNEIDVRVEPLYRYKEGEGTKVLVTLTHQGESPYSDLTVSLGPEGALRAGKRTTQMLTIRPGDEELLELVVAGTELELLLAGSRDGDRSEARVRKPIDPPAPPAGRRFRFLEPRRLARDQHRIYQLTEDGTEGPRRAVREQYGVYLLEGGSQYLVEIRPNQPGARDVRLNEIAGLLQIRKSERTEGGGWQFVVEVSGPPLFRKADRLYYEVETPGGKLSGEIPVCLKQSSSRFWRVAAALGLAVTAQGLVGAGKLLTQVSYSPAQALSEFKPADHYTIFFLLSIPTAWMGLRAADWLYYQIVR